ncbi:MAG: RNA polymerase factor sigma-54 [Gammaproteobacteria bacterium]|nr:RNA polymerase factor sigma-54 [Gammaproteobacteria bacterium]MBT6552245.1 RNA polymerase factor sigma-54 [Gammaproteobacteria bacterium]
MKQSLQLKIGQSLTMTPQLQQAIKLLQLSSIELQVEIQETLDSNPLLEQEDNLSEVQVQDKQPDSDKEDITEIKTSADSLSEDRSQQTLPDELALDTGWDDIYDPTPTASISQTSAGNGEDFRDLFENQAKSTDELYDHLIWQLDCSHLTETDKDIGLALIDGIDDRGYLTESLEDIHQGLVTQHPDIEMDEIEAMLHLIQHFDPLAVGSRTPSECMKIQLQQYDSSTPHLKKAIALVDHYLDYLAKNDIAVLKRRLQANDAELADIIKLIQTTNPHPGQLISTAHAEYIKPDVYVSKVKGEWCVKINQDNAPRLKVNETYSKLIKRGDNSEQNNYLRNNVQEAKWFIKSLQSRNDTLLRVATSIVQRQHDYLDYGDEAMKPMVLRDIAEELEMHESTISRVTTMKFMHTPRGVLEFKYFFSSHVGTADGGECSATAIRAIIKKLIAAEKPNKPLSDNKIANLLDDQGINVARRTIAKYREAMNIPPSNERKRLF